MQIIEKISCFIEEEVDGAKEYAKCAAKMKEEYPSLATAFYTISTQELNHVNMLHDEVTKLINQYKAENGEAPEGMKVLYNYLHDKLIDKVNEVKIYQSQYKD